MKNLILLFALSYFTHFFAQTVGSGMTDIDGNLYNTVIIGTQEWVSENLNVSKYNDGTIIPEVTDPTAWANLTTGAWCYYNNDLANGLIYGKLYNYYAVAGIHDTIAATPNKVLAPIGFHVPTDTNWTTLSDHLGGFNVAGGALKEIGMAHWMSPNTGATNSSGFTGLSDGFCWYYGSFGGMGLYANWWSSTLHTNVTTNTESVWIRHLDHDNAAVTKNDALKGFGFSVRLLKDTLFSDSPSNIETTEAKSIHIYPNPATDNVVIDLGSLSTSGNWNFTITNTLCQEIKKGEISTQKTVININDISGKGLYLIKIYDDSGNYFITKKVQFK
jgi:uncharacterized protein (TIGR02145 family)